MLLQVAVNLPIAVGRHVDEIGPPSLTAGTRPSSRSMPVTCSPVSAKGIASGRPTYPEPHDAESRLSRRKALVERGLARRRRRVGPEDSGDARRRPTSTTSAYRRSIRCRARHPRVVPGRMLKDAVET